MHKKNFLLLALVFWIVFITTLSLVSLNGLPKISPKNGDKYVHFIFYFILTLLLILNFVDKVGVKRSLVISFVIAVFYGIIIEILQGVLTENRKPEFADALVNSFGSLVATIVVFLNRERLNFIK
ncbi:MAG TPA: VanZ family protein [Flavobacterium sp.]|uniref:VanZ family protein n=1 Tax=unclassified Flavobacterium TaxID=196869 RepID=UPI0025BC9322|nr:MULTISPECIES: VanZ family protein [unclassified Flavobacterium]HRE76204.1 VanZ family protein [Flavobacterium sp.]